MRAEQLAFGDGEFDLVTATEVLEHVPDPETVLAEMARVARGHLLVSVPHEPMWRALNLARGAYVRDLGNTPGHLNHWTRRGFQSPAWPLRRGDRDPLAVPMDDAAGGGATDGVGDPPAGARGDAAARRYRRPGQLVVRVRRPGAVDRDRLDGPVHVRLSGDRQPRPEPGLLQPDLAVLGDHVRDPVGDLPADRAAALAHDRRPDRARPARPFAARPGRDPVRLRDRVPDRRDSRCTARSRTASSTARARCTGSS